MYLNIIPYLPFPLRRPKVLPDFLCKLTFFVHILINMDMSTSVHRCMCCIIFPLGRRSRMTKLLASGGVSKRTTSERLAQVYWLLNTSGTIPGLMGSLALDDTCGMGTTALLTVTDRHACNPSLLQSSNERMVTSLNDKTSFIIVLFFRSFTKFLFDWYSEWWL